MLIPRAVCRAEREFGIAWPPALDVAAYRLHEREGGLDQVGATQSSAKLIGSAQLVHGNSFLQAFFQTARRARRLTLRITTVRTTAAPSTPLPFSLLASTKSSLTTDFSMP
jgi:hypothetical protein